MENYHFVKVFSLYIRESAGEHRVNSYHDYAGFFPTREGVRERQSLCRGNGLCCLAAYDSCNDQVGVQVRLESPGVGASHALNSTSSSVMY